MGLLPTMELSHKVELCYYVDMNDSEIFYMLKAVKADIDKILTELSADAFKQDLATFEEIMNRFSGDSVKAHIALTAIQAEYPHLSQRIISNMIQAIGFKRIRRSDGNYYSTKKPSP